MTMLVTDMLNAAVDNQSGRRAYSVLSSVAHGEVTAVSMFLVAREGDAHLRLPAQLAYECTGLLHMACRLVGNQLVAYAGLEREHEERWAAALARAAVSMIAIQSRVLTPEQLRREAQARGKL